MARKKSNRIRIEFRKKYGSRTRPGNLSNQFNQSENAFDESTSSERVSGKGDLTRHRTIVGKSEEVESPSNPSGGVQFDFDAATTLTGLVLRVHGLECIVQITNGDIYRCAVRGLLKSVSTDDRHVVVAGDRVRIRTEGESQGLILRIEPRQNTICRTSRGRRHVLVANVDQLIIVTSAAQPTIKPNLIDRFLVTADQNRIDACICINKCDLIDPAELQPLCGVYAQLGYRVVLVSARLGWGIDLLRDMVTGQSSVVAGQSGVGKSSLLNAIEPGLALKVQTVSTENQKGRHTTTTTEVLPLSCGGAILDTPGIRQFQLWDVVPEELTSLFRDLRPYANHCRFQNCTHRHETDCAVKDAVADGRIDLRRYESFCQILEEPGESAQDRNSEW